MENPLYTKCPVVTTGQFVQDGFSIFENFFNKTFFFSANIKINFNQIFDEKGFISLPGPLLGWENVGLVPPSTSPPLAPKLAPSICIFSKIFHDFSQILGIFQHIIQYFAHNLFSSGPNGLKIYMSGRNIKTPMYTKFQPVLPHRKEVMALFQGFTLKIYESKKEKCSLEVS